MAKKLRRPAVRVGGAPSSSPRGAGRERWPWALTGTPGTGKSRVARALASRFPSVEVAALARERGCSRRIRGGWEVDLARLRRSLERQPTAGIVLVVGHLAHLLPVRGAVVLRCRPTTLRRRLDRCRRGSAMDRDENAVAEALDLVAGEARARRIPCWEVDTTGRPIPAVARAVTRALRARAPPPPSRVDWLSDRSVTAHLLEWQS